MSTVSDQDPFVIMTFLQDSIAPYVNVDDVIQWLWANQTIIWCLVLMTPVVTTLLLPLLMLALVYVSALYLKAYRYYFKANGLVFTPDSWKGARELLAYLYDAQARFWYGYEIEGLENIPSEGPALIVFYHGSIPVDWYYLLAKTLLYKKRLICAVGDRFLFKVPAFDSLIDCFQICPGSVDTCAEMLCKGNLLAIAPGGVREAFFADENYPLMWKKELVLLKLQRKPKF